MVPPIGADSSGLLKLHPRNGRTMNLPLVKKSTKQIEKARDSSILVHGAKLFNSLPMSLRNLSDCSLLEFKKKLDDYITRIADQPTVSGVTNYLGSNSLIQAIPYYQKEGLLSTH